MKTYTVNVTFECVSADNPQEAALKACAWLLENNGASEMVYEVTDVEQDEYTPKSDVIEIQEGTKEYAIASQIIEDLLN